eukprot:13124398-Ditylum_brightwellii.AAC.1
MYAEQKALHDQKRELKKSKKSFDKEEDFIQNFKASSQNDIVYLNVRGVVMAVKRSTLRIFKGSVLDRQFDDTVWSRQHYNKKFSIDWNSEQVADWARNHSEIPDKVANLLQSNKVNGLELSALGRDDLKELGITRPGTLALVANAIEGIKMK